MTEPIEVTEEMRRAVYGADCKEHGHIISIENLINNDNSLNPNENVSSLGVVSKVEGTLPHVFCKRCHKVWLVIDEPGDSYDDVEEKVLNRLKTNDPGRKRLEQLKARRKERRARQVSTLTAGNLPSGEFVTEDGIVVGNIPVTTDIIESHHG
jgi:hypothetical protein